MMHSASKLNPGLGHTEAVEGAIKDLAERFKGACADNIQDIWQHAYRSRFYRGGPVLMSALSGLDIALWDIKGKKMAHGWWPPFWTRVVLMRLMESKI